MQWLLNSLLGERMDDDWPVAPVAMAPIAVLFLFSLLVRTADSSSAFRLDQRWVLERLKREMLQTDALVMAFGPSYDSHDETLAPIEPEPVAGLREHKEEVRRGDTFGGILKRLGIDPSEVTRWSAAAREHASLADLTPGNTFTFLLPSGAPRLAGLQYEVSLDSSLIMHEQGDDIHARLERLPRTVEVLAVGGEIRSTLYGAAVEAGVPEDVVSQMVDVFGWDIDFASQLQRGDSFRVAYEEQRTPTGRRVGGQLLAAELSTGGKTWQAFFFEANDDGGKFYSADGRAYGRAFLRYPVEFTRITSQFSTSRFHPILGIRRPHYGVDFAAPSGTPVRTIGAGTVVTAGWNGGHGRFVKIRHGGGLESSYSHLRSIDRGLRRGARVEMGQRIGTVGATGLATGPHLHFALWRNGVYVNPTSVKLPSAPPLRGPLLADFEGTRDALVAQLAEVKIQPTPIVTVLTSSQSTGG